MNELDNGGKEALRAITDTLSKAMRTLIMWDALHYTGHFIDVKHYMCLAWIQKPSRNPKSGND